MIKKATDMVSEERSAMRGGKGSVAVQHFFSASDFKANVRFCAKLTIPPGASIGQHEHVKEDEVYVVTQGTGLLDDGQSSKRVSAGDAVLTGRGESHAIVNDGNEPLEIIAFIACYQDL